MTTHFSFTIEGHVVDLRTLGRTAYKRALADGLDPKDAREALRVDGRLDVSRCVRMLLDPGVSPDGMEIDDSACEELDID